MVDPYDGPMGIFEDMDSYEEKNPDTKCPVCNNDWVDKHGVCHSCQKQTIKPEPEVNPEVCVACGNYFNYQGGRQVCPKCRRL